MVMSYHYICGCCSDFYFESYDSRDEGRNSVRIHIVQKGDTLWKIARQHGISFEDLKRLNAHLANPDYIVPGMEIILPDVNAKIASPKNTVKEHIVKEHVKETVKEKPPMEKPAKEKPVKEMPLPKPVPMPIPTPVPTPILQPAPQPPYVMPIEMHWTAPVQPSVQPPVQPPVQPLPQQPMQIDLYNLMQMPDVNVQMEMQMPPVQPMMPPMQIQMPQPVPQQEPHHITHVVHVPVPVPVHIQHVVHQPCHCHERPHEKACGCKQTHAMPAPCHQMQHHCPLYTMSAQPWEHGDIEESPTESMPTVVEGMMQPIMPAIDDEREGWRFPESSSCSSSFVHERHEKMPYHHPCWQQYQHGMMPTHMPMPGYYPQMPMYESGWLGQPPIGGSPWMMPYQ